MILLNLFQEIGMKPAWSVFLASCCLVSNLTTANAAGWIAVLKDSPAESFDEEDLHMYLTAAKQTLEAQEQPPQEVQWRNPETGVGGRFLEQARWVDKDGLPCKRIRSWITLPKRPEKTLVLAACQTPDKRWKLLSKIK